MSAEIERILANMIRVGVVAEVDLSDATAPRVKMNVGGLVTDWIPFPAARAGATRTFSAPRVGEQMAVFAPYGDTGQAFSGQSFYQEDHPAPATSQDQEHTVYPDGSTVDYNSATNTLTVTVAAGGNVIVNCKHATVNAENDVTVNTEAATINASESVMIDTPATTVTGTLLVEGMLTYTAGMTGSGGAVAAAISGPLTVSGQTTLAGVTAGGKNVGGTHTHTGVAAGGATSGVPT